MADAIDLSEEPQPEGTTEVAKHIIHFEETKSGFFVSLMVWGWEWSNEVCHPMMDRLPLYDIQAEELDETMLKFSRYHYNLEVRMLPKDEGATHKPDNHEE